MPGRRAAAAVLLSSGSLLDIRVSRSFPSFCILPWLESRWPALSRIMASCLLWKSHSFRGDSAGEADGHPKIARWISVTEAQKIRLDAVNLHRLETLES